MVKRINVPTAIGHHYHLVALIHRAKEDLVAASFLCHKLASPPSLGIKAGGLIHPLPSFIFCLEQIDNVIWRQIGFRLEVFQNFRTCPVCLSFIVALPSRHSERSEESFFTTLK